MDPLKPFTSLIRSLWTSTGDVAKTKRTSAVRTDRTSSGPSDVRAASPIRDRLRSRLVTLSEWEPKRARELFVECILLDQFGDELSRDPTFPELVHRVSAGLQSHEQVARRLDDVLRELISHNPV